MSHDVALICTVNTHTRSTDVPAPAVHPPTEEQFWSTERAGLPDIHFLKDHFYREGRLTENQALFILEKGKDLLKAENNLLEIPAPITGNTSPTGFFGTWLTLIVVCSVWRYPWTVL